MFNHQPVLLKECLDFLQPERGGIFVDGTLGLGGHSEAIIQKALGAKKSITLIGIDQDGIALNQAKERLMVIQQNNPNLVELYFIQDNFANLQSILNELDIEKVDGILLDLGVSSMQLDDADRGFSFRSEAPLDMRMDQDYNTVTAATIVNTWPEFKLANLIYQYGEERLSRRIAKMIVERRRKSRFETTTQLADLIVSAYPGKLRHAKIHPATRTFQALRIEVNREMNVLEEGLNTGPQVLNKDGRMAVISFHSLEDRLVKNAFRELDSNEYKLLTKKPIIASEDEIAQNPRSRSAKLRGIIKN